MKPSNRVLFFGNERLATGVHTSTPIIDSLYHAGYDIAGVIVTPQRDTASRRPRPLEIAEFAKQHKLPLVALDKLKQTADIIKDFNASIGVLAAFGRIIPQDVINIFPHGIVNVHPSLLPKHRGPTPIESFILSGEEQTGVSIMQLVSAMDAGPLYGQCIITLKGNESKQELTNQLSHLGAKMIVDLLPGILNGSIQPKPQTEAIASYDIKIKAADGYLDFTKSAEQLEREVRAYAGWPRSKALINGQLAIITKVHVDANGTSLPGKIRWLDNSFGFETTNGILVIDRLILAGSKEMSSADYLRGHRP